jgi:hypothetical protein
MEAFKFKEVDMTLKPNKSLLWLNHFLNSGNSTTFLHRTNAAIAAGYKNLPTSQTAGAQNYKKFVKEINRWLDDMGLSENALKTKLLSLMDAKETKFFADKGIVTDQREVEALGIQQKALDMAFKIKGSYAPERKEFTGANGGPIQTTNFPPDTDTIESWLHAKARIDAEYENR